MGSIAMFMQTVHTANANASDQDLWRQIGSAVIIMVVLLCVLVHVRENL